MSHPVLACGHRRQLGANGTALPCAHLHCTPTTPEIQETITQLPLLADLGPPVGAVVKYRRALDTLPCPHGNLSKHKSTCSALDCDGECMLYTWKRTP